MMDTGNFMRLVGWDTQQKKTAMDVVSIVSIVLIKIGEEAVFRDRYLIVSYVHIATYA